jgi:hypothetical protein
MELGLWIELVGINSATVVIWARTKVAAAIGLARTEVALELMVITRQVSNKASNC